MPKSLQVLKRAINILEKKRRLTTVQKEQLADLYVALRLRGTGQQLVASTMKSVTERFSGLSKTIKVKKSAHKAKNKMFSVHGKDGDPVRRTKLEKEMLSQNPYCKVITSVEDRETRLKKIEESLDNESKVN